MVQFEREARVVWIKNCLRYNPPANPNVLKSWRNFWDEVPECGLKQKARESLGVFAEKQGKAFEKAFHEAFGEGFDKGLEPSSGLLSPKEKEKETEKEKEGKASPVSEGEKKEKTDEAESFGRFWESYPKRIGKFHAKKAWTKLKPGPELVGKILHALDKQKAGRDWLKEDGQYIPHPTTWLTARRWEDEGKVAAETPGPTLEEKKAEAKRANEEFRKEHGLLPANQNNGPRLLGEILTSGHLGRGDSHV